MPSAYERHMEERYRKYQESIKNALMGIDDICDRAFDREVMVMKITVKLPPPDGGQAMAMAKGFVQGQPKVAFFSAETAVEAIAGLLKKIQNDSVSWKADKFYQEPSEGTA